MSRLYDLKAAVLATWLLAGIFADGWAHNHIDVDSFFTPWHALLYTGYLANAIFYGWTALRARRRGRSWAASVPPGYGWAAFGVLLFFVSGLGDMTWHILLGIEVSVSAGFSPPHLGIMISTGLIVSAPFVAAWKRSAPPTNWSEWLPVILSLWLSLSLMTFVVQYVDPLVVNSAFVRPQHYHDQAIGAMGIQLHAAILMAWILIALRRWRLPSGSLTLIITLNVVALSFMRDRFFLVPAIALAGICADLLMRWLDPSSTRRPHFHFFAFCVPVVHFALYFAAVRIAHGIAWPIPLWTGSAFMAGVVSALISFLILPAPIPES